MDTREPPAREKRARRSKTLMHVSDVTGIKRPKTTTTNLDQRDLDGENFPGRFEGMYEQANAKIRYEIFYVGFL